MTGEIFAATIHWPRMPQTKFFHNLGIHTISTESQNRLRFGRVIDFQSYLIFTETCQLIHFEITEISFVKVWCVR